MITEAELLKLLDLKPSELQFLRYAKGLPYVKLSKTKRVYLEKDLMAFFEAHRAFADLSNVSVEPRRKMQEDGKPSIV
jgi:hypothetical protein